MARHDDDILRKIKEEEQISDDINRRNYIKEKFTYENVIPKEIFDLFEDLPKEEIISEIDENLPVYMLEQPTQYKERNQLFLIKQYTTDKTVLLTDNGEVVPFQVTYDNYPEVYDFKIQGIRQLETKRVQYWKPRDVLIIENELRKIPELHYSSILGETYNFVVLRGYFENKMVNLIVIRNNSYRPTQYRKTFGEIEITNEGPRKLKDFEFGEIINKIADILDDSGINYRDNTRIMLVSDETYRQFNILSSWRRGITGKRQYAILNIWKKYREGIIIEYQANEREKLEKLSNIVFLDSIEDIERSKENLLKEERKYNLKDLNKPITKYMRYAKPKKEKKHEGRKYDDRMIFEILKQMKGDDKEKMYDVSTETLKFKRDKTLGNIEDLERKHIIEEILDKLETKEIKKREKK